MTSYDPVWEKRAFDFLFDIIHLQTKYSFYEMKNPWTEGDLVILSHYLDARSFINRLLDGDRCEVMTRLRDLYCHAYKWPHQFSDSQVLKFAEDKLLDMMILQCPAYSKKLSPTVKAMIEAKKAAEEAERDAVVPGEKVEKWMELKLKDHEGNPVANEEYKVTLADGKVLTGKLDSNGYKKLMVDPEGATVEYPNHLNEEWG